MRNDTPAILFLKVGEEIIDERPITLPADSAHFTDEQNMQHRQELVEFEATMLRRQHLQKLIKIRNEMGIDPVIYLVIENGLNDYDFENEA